MKYILLLLIIVWFAITMSLSSCDKEPKPQPKPQVSGPDTMYVDSEFKRYWVFPEGSWWVYKRTDTTAEVYDTVTVYKSIREVVYYGNAFSYAGEVIRQKLSHSSLYFDYLNIVPATQDVDNTLGYVNNISSAGGFFHYSGFFFWPIDNPRNKYITDTLPITLPIGKVNNVIHFTYWILGEFWMAKDIGFVKYKHNYYSDYKKGPSTWELVNYHINK